MFTITHNQFEKFQTGFVLKTIIMNIEKLGWVMFQKNNVSVGLSSHSWGWVCNLVQCEFFSSFGQRFSARHIEVTFLYSKQIWILFIASSTLSLFKVIFFTIIYCLLAIQKLFWSFSYFYFLNFFVVDFFSKWKAKLFNLRTSLTSTQDL